MSGPEDIRNADPQQYWQAFSKTWLHLLSYRYLGRSNPVLDQGAEHITMPLRHDMRNHIGGISAAPLCIAAAESGGMHDDLYIPNPITANLQIVDEARGVKRVLVLPETLRIGRSMGFSRSRIVDADDPERLIALSSGAAVTLGAPPAGYRKLPNPPLEVLDRAGMPRLHEVFGFSRIAAGVWEMPELVRGTASPDAALHLGPQHIALETAASDMARQAAGREVQIRGWQVQFLGRGKRGPFRTSSQVLTGPAGLCVQVDLFDTGHEQRLVSTALASFAG